MEDNSFVTDEEGKGIGRSTNRSIPLTPKRGKEKNMPSLSTLANNAM